MKTVRIFVSDGETFDYEVADVAVSDCYALPSQADRFEFWRAVTGDDRIQGHAMVWQVIQ
jgi:hypothetical protein